MKMQIEVQRAAEALAQSHRPAQRLASREFGLAGQKSADGAKHDRQRRAPGGGIASVKSISGTDRLDYLTRFHTTRHVSRGSVDLSVRRSPSIW